MPGFHRVSLYVIDANNLQLSSQFLVRENSEETLNFGRAENAEKMENGRVEIQSTIPRYLHYIGQIESNRERGRAGEGSDS